MQSSLRCRTARLTTRAGAAVHTAASLSDAESTCGYRRACRAAWNACRSAEWWRQAQEREYQVLVRDITRAERAEQERVPVNATMREMGFGMHVITVMASCFLAALALGRRLFSEPGLQIVVGAIGMLIALLVETGLFVIQDTRAHERELRAKQKKQ